jgi:hypothetical protein
MTALTCFLHVYEDNVTLSLSDQNLPLSNSGNACCHSVHSFLTFHLSSKKLNIKIYKTTILPVVLYGCETWSLTLREQHRLRMYENRVLRRIFGPKREEVAGGWRRLHNELHILYASILGRSKQGHSDMGGTCSTHGI